MNTGFFVKVALLLAPAIDAIFEQRQVETFPPGKEPDVVYLKTSELGRMIKSGLVVKSGWKQSIVKGNSLFKIDAQSTSTNALDFAIGSLKVRKCQYRVRLTYSQPVDNVIET